MDEYNYRYKTIIELLNRYERVYDKSTRLNKRGIKTTITIQKIENGDWNLKLKIYNEKRESNSKSDPFDQLTKKNGRSK